MKAAIAHQIRPSAMVLGKDSRKKWGKWDFLLAKAYQRYLSELCPQCGLPIYICHSTDNRIEFKTTKDVCFATAAVERKQKQNAAARGKNADPEPGVRYVPEPQIVGVDDDADLELSDFRIPYYKELAVRRGLLPPVESE